METPLLTALSSISYKKKKQSMGYHHSISIRISSAIAANTLRSIQTFSCPQNSQRQPHDHCKHIRSMDQEQRNQTASSEVPERLRVENTELTSGQSMALPSLLLTSTQILPGKHRMKRLKPERQNLPCLSRAKDTLLFHSKAHEVAQVQEEYTTSTRC